MFESSNLKKTVATGVKNENWLHCRELIGKTDINCLGFITGKNAFGDFTALVADDGTNYYIPTWYGTRFKNFSQDEIEYVMSGQPIKVEKRVYDKRFTYDIFIGEYKM